LLRLGLSQYTIFIAELKEEDMPMV